MDIKYFLGLDNEGKWYVFFIGESTMHIVTDKLDTMSQAKATARFAGFALSQEILIDGRFYAPKGY